MKPQTKFIIIGCSVAIAAGATILIVRKIKKNKIEKEKANLNALSTQSDVDKFDTSKGGKPQGQTVSNPIGKKAYVSVKSGYINIRETPMVDDGYIDNLIGKIEGVGTAIGTITGVKKSEQDPPEDWYAIKLDKPMKEWGFTWNNIFVHASDVDVK